MLESGERNVSVVEYVFPFAVAFAVLLLIATAQLIGLGDLIGDADADGSIGDAHAGPLEGLASILGIGRLPFLIWLAILLLMFSGIGITGQFLLDTIFGSMMPPTPAALLATVPAFVLTAITSRIVAPIVPRDETTAVGIETLLGKRGIVDIGTSRRGCAARVIVRDIYGQPHNVMVEPHDDGAEFVAGEEVLLVRLENGLFYAISTADRRLGPVED